MKPDENVCENTKILSEKKLCLSMEPEKGNTNHGSLTVGEISRKK